MDKKKAEEILFRDAPQARALLRASSKLIRNKKRRDWWNSRPKLKDE